MLPITPAQFLRCFPKHAHAAEWAEAINELLPRYEITTPDRVVCFLAQCGHECNGFTSIIENLNYSADALQKTWPLRFPPPAASVYARQPERIGNRAYADRMGNGPEESGDGYRYRGRGCIQLTGKANYLDFMKHAGLGSLDATIEYLETRPGALASACFYWQSRDLNRYADNCDMVSITKKINGGMNGHADRMARFKHISGVL